MLPSRPSRIFRSRWVALMWAVGVLWTTFEVVGWDSSPPEAKHETALTDATGAAVSNADLAVLSNYLSE